MSECLIPLRSRLGTVRATALVDLSDLKLVLSRRWHLSNHGYAVGKKDGRNQPLHRMIMGLDFGDEREVDHVNGDKLDNRRENLRVVTRAENAQNRTVAHGAVDVVGVSKSTRLRRYRAQCWIGGNAVHLGYFDTPEHAADAVTDYRASVAPFSAEARERKTA